MNTTFTGRREDDRLLRGEGRYTDDWSLPGQAWAVFLRSDVAHAHIAGIDVEEARAAPGVLAVLTGADMAAAGYFRVEPRMPFTGVDGPLRAPRKPALAQDRVRFVGEAVALVVAETQAQALAAAEMVEMDLVTLDNAGDQRQAIGESAPQLHEEIPGNICFSYEYGNHAEVDRAFAGAAHVARVELDSARVIGNPMEPRAGLVAWDGDTLDLWCPSQGLAGIERGMASATGLPPETFRIHTEDVGGAFGVRGDACLEYAAMALAARRIGRPVKWLASRSETFFSDHQGRGIRMTAELALDAEGRFLAIRHDWLCDLGAHPSGAGPVTGVQNATLMASGAYRIAAIAGRTRQVVTNRVPVTAYRGAGRPEMAYAVERLVDEAARVTGRDRIDLRRLNCIPPGDFPYSVPTAIDRSSYDSADFPGLLDRALAASDWDGFEARRDAAKARGRLRGIGCALFIEPSGGVSPTDEAAITFDADGRARLHQAAQSSGQGHETVFPEIVAATLGIPAEEVTLEFTRSDGPGRAGGGAFGSRSLMTQGSVLQEAATQVLAKAALLAARVLDVDAEMIEHSEGVFRARDGNRFVGLADLARQNPGALDTVAMLPSPKAYPSGMHVAEVEIDPETGALELIGYVSVDDCGTVVNETLVQGQIWGGLVQGLGQVLGEACHYDADGQMLTGSFMDYVMPRAETVRGVRIILAPVPSPTNRLGAKGVGEAGTVGALPTAMNAVLDALWPAGVRYLDMPATSHRIWQALNAG